MTDFDQAKTAFLQSIESGQHVFTDTLSFIETWYDFTPTAFRNGDVSNSAEQNQGSCKVFALAELLDLSKEQTLLCFGEHYRDVLATPDTDNHHNLRRVLREGRDNIRFGQFPLQAKG